MEEMKAGARALSVFKTLKELRRHGVALVRSVDQFAYIHLCLAHAIHEALALEHDMQYYGMHSALNSQTQNSLFSESRAILKMGLCIYAYRKPIRTEDYVGTDAWWSRSPKRIGIDVCEYSQYLPSKNSAVHYL